MKQEALFIALLKASGERISSPRLALFQLLQKLAPVSTGDLVAAAKGKAIDQATTYRNIGLFRSLGVTKDIVSGGRRLIELTDEFGSHHDHFACERCGALTDFDDEVLELAISDASRRLGVQIATHQLEMTGLCASCLAKQ